MVKRAATCAILVLTEDRSAEAHPTLFKEAHRVGMSYLLPFVITIAAILATDLLVGIGIGLAVGAFFILMESAKNAGSYQVEESADHHRVRITLAENMNFLCKARVVAMLRGLPTGCVVTVDGSRSRHIDHDVLEILHEFHATSSSRGITARLVGIPTPRIGAAAH